MSLKEDIITTLKANAPLEFTYDRAVSRYGSEHDEELVCNLLNGEMHSNKRAPYDFIVQGQKLDLKVGNSINLSCLSHDDVDYILASKDGKKFKYIEHSYLYKIIDRFSPSKHYDAWSWPICILRDAQTDELKAVIGDIYLGGERYKKFVDFLKQNQYTEIDLRNHNRLSFINGKYHYEVRYSNDYVYINY